MKIIRPYATLMEHDVTPYEFIEKVGRTCYKSEDKITKGSAEKFVENLVKRNHWAMLEHETIYLVVSEDFMEDFLEDMAFNEEPLTYFNITYDDDDCIISGSFRSFHDLFEKCYSSVAVQYMEMGLHFTFPLVFDEFEGRSKYAYSEGDCVYYLRNEFIKKFKNRPEVLFKHLTHTFKFVCDRGVSHEFVRHRPASFAQESTRYCNYRLDKFGEEITVIEPCFWERDSAKYLRWKIACENAEDDYFKLLKEGATPQEARTILPNSLKTELIITATEQEWQHIVNLRYLGTTGAPHPQMKEVMGLAIEDLINQSNGRINILDKGAE